jgi:DNA-binding CsgD family transcriptional regulator
MTATSDSAQSFIDKIYEAAVIPELWTTVLEDLTAVGDGTGSLLFTIAGDRMKWIGSPSIVESATRYIEQGWPARSTRAARLFSARHAGFLNDLDVYTAEEIENEPVFTEFLRPEGFGWGAASAIPVPTGDTIIFNVEKAYNRGPVDRAALDRLDAFRPHLARAGLFAWRMELRRAQAIAQALHAVGLPGAVLRVGGKLHAANPLFEALMPAVAMDRQDRLAFADLSADQLFSDALERLHVRGASGQSRSIPLAKFENQPPMIVHVLPVRGMANDIFASSVAIVIITPVDRGAVPTAELLEGLFDLTPAEARVARAIAEGSTIDAIALASNLSRETLRSQLAAVFGKTGVSRQAELAALLGGLALPRTDR